MQRGSAGPAGADAPADAHADATLSTWPASRRTIPPHLTSASLIEYLEAHLSIDVLCEVLHTRPNHVDALCLACEVLHTYASSSKSTHVRALESGGLEVLVNVIDSHMADARLVEEACAVLDGLCTTIPDFASTIASTRAFDFADVLIRAHRMHASNQLVCAQTLMAMASLGTNNDAARRLLAAGAIEGALAAVSRYSSSNELIFSASFAVLACATHSDEGKLAILAMGSATTIVTALRERRSQRRIAAVICNLISALCATLEEPREQFAAAGCIQAVLDLLREHQAATSELSSMLGALSNLVMDGEHRIAEAGRLGAVALLASTARKHASNAVIVCDALDVLAILTDHDQANRRAFAADDGLRLVLTSLFRHASDLATLTRALGALGCLLKDDTVQREVVAENGVLAVVRAMKQHSTSTHVAHIACSILTDLVDHDEGDDREQPTPRSDENVATIARVVDASAVLWVVQALRRFPHHGGIVHSASSMLLNLVWNGRYKAMILDAGGLNAAEAAAKAQATKETEAEAVVKAEEEPEAGVVVALVRELKRVDSLTQRARALTQESWTSWWNRVLVNLELWVDWVFM